jgi:hypothetical protein
MAYGTNKKKASPVKKKAAAKASTKKANTSDLIPESVNNRGGYYAFRNGRVGRTNGMYGPYESMDTTGYSKGKKTFELMESRPGLKPNKKTISRSEVPATISRFKKGARKIVDETLKSKKSK